MDEGVQSGRAVGLPTMNPDAVIQRLLTWAPDLTTVVGWKAKKVDQRRGELVEGMGNVQ